MKIVVLGTRGFPNVQGGVEKHCEELYPRLVVLGCQVTVIGRSPYIGKKPYEYKGISILPLVCPRNKFLEAFVHTFLGVIKARIIGCDILHIHAIGPSLFVPWARLLGLKVVMTHHGPDYERKKWNGFAKFIIKLGERCGVTCANQVICISQTIKEHILKLYGREATVIPNGVNIPPILISEDTLKRFGLQKGKYILAVGRFVKEKGFHDLIDAFVLAKDSLPSIKLVIVGDADHEDEYSRGLKKKAGEAKDVVLTGFLAGQALQEMYSHAGLFVLPSYYEGLPIVLLEAMSFGLPCIVSDILPNREVELGNERYFSPGDVDALAKNMMRFLDQPMTFQEKALQIKMISEKYNWDNISVETFKVYSEGYVRLG